MVVGDAGVDEGVDDDEDEHDDDDDNEEDAVDANVATADREDEVLDDDGRARSVAAIGNATDADGGRVIVRKSTADVDLDLDCGCDGDDLECGRSLGCGCGSGDKSLRVSELTGRRVADALTAVDAAVDLATLIAAGVEPTRGGWRNATESTAASVRSSARE
jgi:hypothetical protein